MCRSNVTTAHTAKETSDIASTKGMGLAAPKTSGAVSEEGPVPSLAHLNVCSYIEAKEDQPRGIVYVMIPWAGAYGSMQV